uniref:Glyco_hydro_19_cat domain-containing protein n=1 Tax=Parastrongyloides trichosuri TaxID=131310 RepID=A0A0N4ZQW2_PARTI
MHIYKIIYSFFILINYSYSKCPKHLIYSEYPKEGCKIAKDPNKMSRSPIEKWFKRRMFNDLFPKANLGVGPHPCLPYSYEAFIIAARYFPEFGSGSKKIRGISKEELQKRDVAAYFAHIIQETGENNYIYFNSSLNDNDALKCFYQGGLYHWFEGGPNSEFLRPNKTYTVDDGEYCNDAGRYCSKTPESQFWYPCNDEKKIFENVTMNKGCYFGRGPLQLSWNYNYGQFQYWLHSKKIEVDLLNDPNLLMKKMDPPLGMLASLWFYMTPQPPKPSMHSIITGKWLSSIKNRKIGYKDSVFGPTSLVINNECSGEEVDELVGGPGENRRIKAYKWFCSYFNITAGSEKTLTCKNMIENFEGISHNHSWQPNWSTMWKSEPCDCTPTQYNGALPYYDPSIYYENYDTINEQNRLRCVYAMYQNPKRYNIDETNSPCIKHRVKLRLSRYGLE